MGRSVLVVDPMAHIGRLLQVQMERASFEVSTVADGQEGLDWLASNAVPDLVVTQIVMRGVDGFQVAEAMRRRSALKRVPIVFIGYHSNEIARNEFERTTTERLQVPYGPCDVVAALFNPQAFVLRVEALLEANERDGDGDGGDRGVVG